MSSVLHVPPGRTRQQGHVAPDDLIGQVAPTIPVDRFRDRAEHLGDRRAPHRMGFAQHERIHTRCRGELAGGPGAYGAEPDDCDADQRSSGPDSSRQPPSRWRNTTAAA